MDPARSERPASEALTGADRDARIEQLLLAGLDRYFANDYDEAINLWTRVLFLDRHHDRARAYIERARSTQAERQRESEALMHEGLDAFTSGDVARARELVARALERGASRDLALGVLDRIERLGAMPAATAPPTRERRWLPSRAAAHPAAMPTPPERRRAWGGSSATVSASVTVLLIVAALGAAAVAAWGVTLPDLGRWSFAAAARPAAPIVAAAVEPLPLAAASELYIARSRSFFRRGRLQDALHELDRVPAGGAERVTADRLRAEIQAQLLAVAAAEPRPTHEVP
jgi:hypothetical protein